MKKYLVVTVLTAAVIGLLASHAWACECGRETACPNCATAKSKTMDKTTTAAPVKSDPLAEKLLAPYLAIRTALAEDKTDGVAKNASDLAATLKEAVESSAKNKKPATYIASLKGLSGTLEPLTGKDLDVEKARKDFGAFSDAFVEYLKANVSAVDTEKYQLYYCGMAKHFWLQKAGEKIGNPYYGKDMSVCGKKMFLHAADKNAGDKNRAPQSDEHGHNHGM